MFELIDPSKEFKKRSNYWRVRNYRTQNWLSLKMTKEQEKEIKSLLYILRNLLREKSRRDKKTVISGDYNLLQSLMLGLL